MTDGVLVLLIACIPIIWGSKWFFTDYGMVQHPCPKCGRKPTLLRHGRQRAHVYHIPLFKTKESHVARCEACDSDWILDEATGLRLRLEALQSSGPGAQTGTPTAVKRITEATAGTQPGSCPACGAPRGAGNFCGQCGAQLPAMAASGASSGEGQARQGRPPPPPPRRKDLAES